MMKTTIKTCTHCSADFDPAKPHVCAAHDFAKPPLPKAGMVIDKKYRLISKLGEGGMGSIFRARRMFINDFVALKFMRPEVVAHEDIRQRFYHEARVAARIKHPNVVTVYDFGETAEGLAYLVMELLSGQSLGQLLHKQGTLDLEQMLDLGIQICEALTCMLEHNVIHRDLKPDNIMLVPDGREGWLVKVVDFGVAKILEDDYQLTRVQARIGSPVYSSPEQYLGKYVDHRTDLYGLGVIFYECLTGHLPFEALTQNELLSALVHKMPARLDEKIPGFTTLMADLVQWLLAKDPNDRPRDATEVSRCLQTLRDGKKTLLRFEDERRGDIQPLAPAAQREKKSPTRRNGTNKARNPRSKPAAQRPQNFAPLSPVFQPRSIRRRLKRKLKKLFRPALAVSGVLAFAACVWWILSGMPAMTDFEPVVFISSLWQERSNAVVTPQVRKPVVANTNIADSIAANNGAPATPASNSQTSLGDTSRNTPSNQASSLKPEAVSNRGIVPRVQTAMKTKTGARVLPINAALPRANLPPANMIFVRDTVYQRGDLFGDGAPNERPAHWVRLEGFYIGKYEVTNEEYMAFVAATKSHLPVWMDPASKYYYQGGTDNLYKKLGTALYDPTHPVVGVSWDDAAKYCEWLSQKGPWKFRLPTEAEWEVAACGGKYKYAWGEGAPQPGKGGNIADEALKQVLPNLAMIWRAYNDAYIYTSPVGKFGANAFGLYDMTGNVWEWCSDWYEANVYQRKEIGNPQGPATGTQKAIRGGSWSDTPDKLRISFRRGVPPTFRSNNLGFRVVAEAR